MLRRSFLQLLAAAIVTPALTPLETLTPAAPIGPILAVEVTMPYWLLELQAYEHFFATWSPQRGWVDSRSIPKLPLKPDVRA